MMMNDDEYVTGGPIERCLQHRWFSATQIAREKESSQDALNYPATSAMLVVTLIIMAVCVCVSVSVCVRSDCVCVHSHKYVCVCVCCYSVYLALRPTRYKWRGRTGLWGQIRLCSVICRLLSSKYLSTFCGVAFRSGRTFNQYHSTMTLSQCGSGRCRTWFLRFNVSDVGMICEVAWRH
jgi:hypothetical protein